MVATSGWLRVGSYAQRSRPQWRCEVAIPFLGDIIGGVIDIGKRLVPDRAANDAAKAAQAQRQQEIEGALHQKQVEQIGKAEDYASAWNLAQANAAQTSWKDEYWTIVLSI